MQATYYVPGIAAYSHGEPGKAEYAVNDWGNNRARNIITLFTDTSVYQQKYMGVPFHRPQDGDGIYVGYDERDGVFYTTVFYNEGSAMAQKMEQVQAGDALLLKITVKPKKNKPNELGSYTDDIIWLDENLQPHMNRPGTAPQTGPQAPTRAEAAPQALKQPRKTQSLTRANVQPLVEGEAVERISALLRMDDWIWAYGNVLDKILEAQGSGVLPAEMTPEQVNDLARAATFHAVKDRGVQTAYAELYAMLGIYELSGRATAFTELVRQRLNLPNTEDGIDAAVAAAKQHGVDRDWLENVVDVRVLESKLKEIAGE